METILAAELPFAGKIALVTGSGRGIGRSIALHFAQDGADVIVNFFRNRAPAEETAAAILAYGRQALLVKADVGTDAGLDHLLKKSKKTSAGWTSWSATPPRATFALLWNRSRKAGTGR